MLSILLSILPFAFMCTRLVFGVYQHCQRVKEGRLAHDLSGLLDTIPQIKDFSTPEAHAVVTALIDRLQESRGIKDFEFLDQERKIFRLHQLLEA